MSALGTLWSPRCTTLDPTQCPSCPLALVMMRCISRYTRGASCIRCRPWPVSPSRYRLVSESMSSSARHQSLNMPSMMRDQRVRDWRT